MMDTQFYCTISKKIINVERQHVLVEMSYSKSANQFVCNTDLQINGYQPILAHPERYAYHNALEIFKSLKNAGCLFQLNLLATVGYYGKRS
jgi:tyrosine-protein phosphatase YwqE